VNRDDIAVEVEGLRRVFGDFVAVDNIDLSVKKGEIFGFLGPNGAGKSTTIRMLCGLLIPTSGEAKVGGFDIVTETEHVKHAIGYMSQKPPSRTSASTSGCTACRSGNGRNGSTGSST